MMTQNKNKMANPLLSLNVNASIDIIYGALYNWYAATDARNICADGWHIPTDAEAFILSNFLDPLWEGIDGGKLKEIGTTYWNAPNMGATNEVGFNGRGSGERFYNGLSMEFTNLKDRAVFWNSDVDDLCFGVVYNSNAIQFWGGDKIEGFSLRPIKDSTTLTHGQTGTYTGNDGKIYRTICIGTQEWLADNLAETKYRNGDAIPIVTDNATWAALVTGAMCYYNNDISFSVRNVLAEPKYLSIHIIEDIE